MKCREDGLPFQMSGYSTGHWRFHDEACRYVTHPDYLKRLVDTRSLQRYTCGDLVDLCVQSTE